MAEKLTAAEGIALAFAEGGMIETPFGDAIPQRVWTDLYARDLIRLGRDHCGEYFTSLTNPGREALLEHLRIVGHGLEAAPHV